MSFKDTKTNNECIKDYKTLKVLLKIIKVHIIPVIIFALGYYYEEILHCNPGAGCPYPMYELLYGLGILTWCYLLFSIPISIISLISSIVQDLIKMFKK